MLIDCDIHVTYRSLGELVPYADAHTRELIERSGVAGLSMPTYPWVHPSGWIRRDTYDAEAVEAGSMFPGFTLAQLREHVLDPLDVAFAIANPDEAACFCVLPNARLAAGLASAYNDWLADTWLRAAPRLRGALVVPAQSPEAAAAEPDGGRTRRLRRRAVAARPELALDRVGEPLVPAPAVRVRVGSRAVHDAAARGARRPGAAGRGAAPAAARAHADVRDRLPALGLRRPGPDAAHAAAGVARADPLPHRRRVVRRARPGGRVRTLRFPRSAAPAPGQVRTVESGGRRIGLVWVDGVLHGLADACPHRGAPLCSAGVLVHRVESDGERVVRREPADRLRCPWHKWDFDVRTGGCAEAPRMRVRRYRVWLEDDEIVVSLAPVRD